MILITKNIEKSSGQESEGWPGCQQLLRGWLLLTGMLMPTKRARKRPLCFHWSVNGGPALLTNPARTPPFPLELQKGEFLQ